MKIIWLAVPVTAAAVAGAAVVGGAGAQLPNPPSAGGNNNGNSITVNGIGTAGPVPKTSGVSARKDQYATALSDAMDDAKTKATAIATKAGTTLTGVNSATENTSAAACGAPKTRTTCTLRAAVTVEYAIP